MRNLVHENWNKLFTDEEFSMIETWQLSEIRKGPETVRKKGWERIKIINHNNTFEICNNYGDVKFREHVLHENGDKWFTDQKFSMVETWELSHIRKGLEKVRKPKILKIIKFIKDNHTSEICNYYGYVNFRKKSCLWKRR